jgi:hypothetical protein
MVCHEHSVTHRSSAHIAHHAARSRAPVGLREPAFSTAADLVELHARIITAQEVFAAQAMQATGLEELDQSAEAQTYRAMQADVFICQELQTRIDATAAHAAFADVPWIPGAMKEVVEVTLWC